eukprot:7322909-Pyramimonas_sp.AAC.1
MQVPMISHVDEKLQALLDEDEKKHKHKQVGLHTAIKPLLTPCTTERIASQRVFRGRRAFPVPPNESPVCKDIPPVPANESPP